ncbi:MAG: STM4014 family protein [Pirellulaceae bacterium]
MSPCSAKNSILVLRIDSPGENFQVERQLIALGSEAIAEAPQASRISAHAARRLRYDRGKIYYPRQWYCGFTKLLDSVQASASTIPAVHWTHSPTEIQMLFDKLVCHARLEASMVPVAPCLYPVQSFDELVAEMERRGWKRVFAKLRWGSSASGVMAIYHDRSTTRAVTSMEMVGSGPRVRFYNNLKLNTYTRISQIRRAFEFLCREGVHVEQWLPKAAMAGRQFDLRLVTIAGQARHAVVRTSKSPITNLHLGNKRGELTQLQSQIGSAGWKGIEHVAQLAAAQFPGSHCLGIDLLLGPGFRKPTVLEVNAFGDLLPGVEHHHLNTYEAQVANLLATLRAIPGETPEHP